MDDRGVEATKEDAHTKSQPCKGLLSPAPHAGR